MPIGYELNPLIRFAITEGIVTVALTLRFLKYTTTKGFLWIPGTKYEFNSEKGDLDVAAVCDGRVVFCECKPENRKEDDWKTTFEQFEALVEIGKHCKADLVVLATLAESIPQDRIDNATRRAAGQSNLAFLTKGDLEDGSRRMASESADMDYRMRIDDYLK